MSYIKQPNFLNFYIFLVENLSISTFNIKLVFVFPTDSISLLRICHTYTQAYSYSFPSQQMHTHMWSYHRSKTAARDFIYASCVCVCRITNWIRTGEQKPSEMTSYTEKKYCICFTQRVSLYCAHFLDFRRKLYACSFHLNHCSMRFEYSIWKGHCKGINSTR